MCPVLPLSIFNTILAILVYKHIVFLLFILKTHIFYILFSKAIWFLNILILIFHFQKCLFDSFLIYKITSHSRPWPEKQCCFLHLLDRGFQHHPLLFEFGTVFWKQILIFIIIRHDYYAFQKHLLEHFNFVFTLEEIFTVFLDSENGLCSFRFSKKEKLFFPFRASESIPGLGLPIKYFFFYIIFMFTETWWGL